MGGAEECDDGDAHPEGFAGDGCSVIGVGVQGDVDHAVELEMAAGVGDSSLEIDAIGVDAGGGENLGESLLGSGVIQAGIAFDDHAAVGDGGEDLGPEFCDAIVDL